MSVLSDGGANPEHLWSLREDVVVVEEPDGDMLVGDVRLVKPDAVVRDAVRRMTLGPVLLGNVAGAGTGDDVSGPDALARALRSLHLLVVRSLGAGDSRGPLLSVLPLGRRPFVPPRVGPDSRIIGRPTTPTDFRVEVHRPEVATVLELPSTGASAREIASRATLPVPLALAVLGYLGAAGRVCVVADSHA